MLTLVGTVLAAAALVGDWRAHRGGEPLIPLSGRLWRWFKKRVLLRKPSVHRVSVGRATSWDVAAAATGYSAPPSNAPVDVQMRFVRERLIALERRIGSERQEVDQKIARVQEATQAMNARSESSLNELRETVRDLATGSVRLELLGLILVGVGSVIAAVPSAFAWP
ncbi:hypothetical protein HPO96_10640 [Kribbella sandramycini]|uniref:Uncharacterized protein n=1 Tax=Kribbella sandramycini TaxID=60450 RepID=A0A7Y4KXY2_9ACTN|nr:hypothetical protein [Kribbella sandramycini]MBB6569463.1 hypothetical protein [Kribbella sandramycini]NOL40703.1 hypothetical protein [Kribbella sandramycini]